jgi:hypothetical protein
MTQNLLHTRFWGPGEQDAVSTPRTLQATWEEKNEPCPGCLPGCPREEEKLWVQTGGRKGPWVPQPQLPARNTGRVIESGLEIPPWHGGAEGQGVCVSG